MAPWEARLPRGTGHRSPRRPLSGGGDPKAHGRRGAGRGSLHAQRGPREAPRALAAALLVFVRASKTERVLTASDRPNVLPVTVFQT